MKTMSRAAVSLARQVVALKRNKRLITTGASLFAVIATFWNVTAWAAQPPQAVPSIAVTAAGITVSGLTPRALAIVFGICREQHGYVSGYVRRNYLLRSVDALGSAQINLGSVPLVSVWSVVDLQSGLYATTAPSGYPLRRGPVPADALRAGGDGQLNRLRLKHEFLEVLWVRSGVGAWQASVGDGGASDADNTVDGHLSIAPEQMEALGASPPPPAHYLPTDTLILVDPDTMELFTIPVSR
jgi:hypothetical protein